MPDDDDDKAMQQILKLKHLAISSIL